MAVLCLFRVRKVLRHLHIVIWFLALGGSHLVLEAIHDVPQAGWTIINGSCIANGTCVQSGGYPNDYAAGDNCTFMPATGHSVTATSFRTRMFYDVLSINEIEFTGNCGPNRVVPIESKPIVWSSSDDYNIALKGSWTLCLEPMYELLSASGDETERACAAAGRRNINSEEECRFAAGLLTGTGDAERQWEFTRGQCLLIRRGGTISSNLICLNLPAEDVDCRWQHVRIHCISIAVACCFLILAAVMIWLSICGLQFFKTVLPKAVKTSLRSTQENVVNGHALHQQVPSHRWCVTRTDLVDLRGEIVCAIEASIIAPTSLDPFDPEDRVIGPNIYTVVEQFIKPVTASIGNPSWALMLHPEGLECDLFVTHGWMEGVFEFIDKVVASWPRTAQAAYCCMLSNPQNLDISALITSPSSSPFAKAMEVANFMLVVPNRQESIYNRMWCAYEAFLAYKSNKFIFTASLPVNFTSILQQIAVWSIACSAPLLYVSVSMIFVHSEPIFYINPVRKGFVTGYALFGVILMASGGSALYYFKKPQKTVTSLISLGSGAVCYHFIFQIVYGIAWDKGPTKATNVALVIALFVFAVVSEADRVRSVEKQRESEEVRKDYSGHVRDAKCYLCGDAVGIMDEITASGSEDAVDHAIGVLILSGMSTPELRQTARLISGYLANVSTWSLHTVSTVFFFFVDISVLSDASPMKCAIIVEVLVCMLMVCNLRFWERGWASAVIWNVLIEPIGLSMVMVIICLILSKAYHIRVHFMWIFVRFIDLFVVPFTALFSLPVTLTLIAARPVRTARFPLIGRFLVRLCIGHHGPCYGCRRRLLLNQAREKRRTRLSVELETIGYRLSNL